MWNKESLISADVWNVDETGFRIGCMRGRMVVIHAGQKSAYTVAAENRGSVTVMKTISADGRVILPMLIMQGAIFKEKLFMNDLSDDAVLAIRIEPDRIYQ